MNWSCIYQNVTKGVVVYQIFTSADFQILISTMQYAESIDSYQHCSGWWTALLLSGSFSISDVRIFAQHKSSVSCFSYTGFLSEKIRNFHYMVAVWTRLSTKSSSVQPELLPNPPPAVTESLYSVMRSPVAADSMYICWYVSCLFLFQ